jgi:hypothetical protein
MVNLLLFCARLDPATVAGALALSIAALGGYGAILLALRAVSKEEYPLVRHLLSSLVAWKKA